MFPFDKSCVSDASYLYSSAAVWPSVTLPFWNLIIWEDIVTIKGLDWLLLQIQVGLMKDISLNNVLVESK